LTAISKIDDKIAKFEDLLKKMKTDLYSSIEMIAEEVNKTNEIEDPPKRGVPKIVSNVQLVPPRPIPAQQQIYESQEDLEPFSDLETWTEVTGKKRRRQVRIATSENLEEPPDVGARAAGFDRSGGRPPPPSGGTRRRAPRNAAVSIKINAEGPSYADIIKLTREKVNLKDIGITNPRMRRAANGGIIIEIAGPEGANKADTLASRLRDAIGGSATVSRPVVKADLKISGFDEPVIKDEIITVITEFGCLANDVRVGSFRAMRSGLNMTWVQCPLFAALKISKKGKINLGWSVARVELMKARPIQCFKCWKFGHVRNNCDSPIDRTGHCFQCSGTNHNSYLYC